MLGLSLPYMCPEQLRSCPTSFFCFLPSLSPPALLSSQPGLKHLGPHRLHGASQANINTIPVTHTHTHTQEHTHLTPRAAMTQHAPTVTRALIVIEVKEKKQQADFRRVRGGKEVFSTRPLPHSFRWDCLAAHRRQAGARLTLAL